MKKINGLSFEFLMKHYEPLNKETQIGICGGDITDDLFSKVFNTSGLNANLLTIFTNNLHELESTAVGYDMLTSLYNSSVSAGIKINLSNDMPTDPSAAAQYFSGGTHSVRLGNYDPDMSSKSSQIGNSDSTAHELYHAYQEIVQLGNNPGNYYKDVKSELDACIFQRMFDSEYDTLNKLDINDDNSHMRLGRDTSNLHTGGDQVANAAFTGAWDDLFVNHNLTLANYNTMIDNFATGTNYLIGPSNPKTVIHVTSLDSTKINDFFNNDFKNYFNTPSSNSGTSSTTTVFDPPSAGPGKGPSSVGSSGSGGSSSFGSNDFGYATGFNGGGSTYSYNPVDFGGSWYGYGNAPATMVGNGGQQIRVDIEPY